MKTPRFWQSKNILSSALLPAAYVYGIISQARAQKKPDYHAHIPVICIGNTTAGGAGKTPLALHIGAVLASKDAYFLSRGYGGAIKAATLVDPAKHTAREVGDEPLLLARTLPTIISPGRAAGAKLAESLGAKMIVMDDGFQNPSLHKDLSILVIDGERGFGNGRLLPAGPLRESPDTAAKRADALVVMNAPPQAKPLFAAFAAHHAKPLFYATTKLATENLPKRKWLAFCGLAYPEKFFTSLAQTGAEIVKIISYPDHHPYSEKDAKRLLEAARAWDASLITTAKDAVRLPETLRSQVTIAELSLNFEDPDALAKLLAKVAP